MAGERMELVDTAQKATKRKTDEVFLLLFSKEGEKLLGGSEQQGEEKYRMTKGNK